MTDANLKLKREQQQLYREANRDILRERQRRYDASRQRPPQILNEAKKRHNREYYQENRSSILRRNKINFLRKADLPKEIKEAKIMELLNNE